MNEYGAGLRDVIERGRHLWGWVDFGSYQVFDEATVYTALQFFSKRPNDNVAVVEAPNGVVAESPWEIEDIRLNYDRLAFGDRWLLVTGAERDLIDKIIANALRLDDERLTTGIHQGLITSADHIYHLKRLGANRYEEKAANGEAHGRIVEIEDHIMKPLVSGPETSRYITPETETYLLFPYHVQDQRASLIPSNRMQAEYPHAWAYLIGHEQELRARENGGFNDAQWWRFGRSQNLGKQEVPKLLVAQTVRTMQVAADAAGAFYINNVRVNGVVPSEGVSIWFLLSALNAKAAGFVFGKTAKPKDNGYFEANKQFIKYLPIPEAEEEDRFALAKDAERLQELNDLRRRALRDISLRMATVRARPRPDEWLFPDLPDLQGLKIEAPKRLSGRDRGKWAKERLARELEARHAALDELLRPGIPLAAEIERGELRFLIDGIPVITGIFPPPAEASFILAQWKVLASRTEVTAQMNGKKLSDNLKKVCVNAEEHIMADVIRLQGEVTAAETEIMELEQRINETIYRLHKLTRDEIALIEASNH